MAAGICLESVIDVRFAFKGMFESNSALFAKKSSCLGALDPTRADAEKGIMRIPFPRVPGVLRMPQGDAWEMVEQAGGVEVCREACGSVS